jgi:hypothetical protein
LARRADRACPGGGAGVRPDPAERGGIEALLDRRGYHIPVGLTSLAIDLLVRIHGYVVMEAFGQLRPMTADPAATFGRTVDEALSGVGLDC